METHEKQVFCLVFSLAAQSRKRQTGKNADGKTGGNNVLTNEQKTCMMPYCIHVSIQTLPCWSHWRVAYYTHHWDQQSSPG